jgi:hypothetical protein
VLPACESASKRDPGSSHYKALKFKTKLVRGGVPIGADRVPTLNESSL